MDKTATRIAMMHQLQALDKSSLDAMSRHVCLNALATIDWSLHRRVYCYQSQPQLYEVDTTWLAEQLRSHFNLTIDMTPATTNAALPSALYDLIIVPLVAYTSDCHRLGRGGGWYDRLLAKQPHAQTVGLAYELQRLTKLPVEPHDAALTTVITEMHTYTS